MRRAASAVTRTRLWAAGAAVRRRAWSRDFLHPRRTSACICSATCSMSPNPTLATEFELLRTDRVTAREGDGRQAGRARRTCQLGSRSALSQATALSAGRTLLRRWSRRSRSTTSPPPLCRVDCRRRPRVRRQILVGPGARDRAWCGTPGGDGFRAPCGVVAWRCRRRVPRSKTFAAAGLDGLEVDHPDHDEPTRERLRSNRARPRLAGHRLQRLPRVGEVDPDSARTPPPRRCSTH